MSERTGLTIVFGILVNLFTHSAVAQANKDQAWQQHPWGISVAHTGLSLPYTASRGAGIQYRPIQQWEFEANYRHSETNLWDWITSDTVSKERQYGVMAKHFLSRTFNVSFGYIYRQNDIYFDNSRWGISQDANQTKAEVDSHNVKFSFGNSWQIQHASISIDWIGISRSIFGSTHRSASDKAGSSSDRQFIKDHEKDMQDYMSIEFLTINLGLRF